MAQEAPEGIVAFSWSGNPPNAGATGIQVGLNMYIDTSDIIGGPNGTYAGTEYLQLTDTYIETMDAICEGIIEGPLSGVWQMSGNLGQTGWSSGYFSGYLTPSGTTGLGWLQSIYYDQLPVVSSAGQFNFQDIDISYAVGLPNGSLLQDLENVQTTSRSIGARLYAGIENAQVFRILNANCKGTIVNIRFPALNNENASNGNIERSLVQWQIAYRPVFSTVAKNSQFNPPVSPFIFGKIASAGGYINSTQINFNLNTFYQNNNLVVDNVGFLSDQDFIGWEIQVTRLTPDSSSALLTNASYVDSITEIYGNLMSYPNTAIIRSTFNAEYFSDVPTRGFECNFIKVNIPANYDPIFRTYATSGYGTTNGYWNGCFASGKQWTNNPAWCFYDLITNPRYGLGKYIDNIDIYDLDLYNIAQYCDELVADGYGGLEPRFTCNVWIPQKSEAYQVVNDMASIFRGMVYYFNGILNATQDGPKTTRMVFTNGNVENGEFSYSSTAKSSRQSVAVVRYNDPNNFYQPAIEYVDYLDAIRRYGVRELPITAFGCTSRGQAIRLGKWALYTNNIECESISFTAGTEINLLNCGDVFAVADYNRKLKRYGGRTWQMNNTGNTGINYTGAIVTLDSNIDLETGIQYSFSLMSPSFYFNQSSVTGLTSNDYPTIHKPFIQTINFSGDWTWQSGNNTIVNLPSGFDSYNYNISGNPVWMIELGPNSQSYTGNFYFPNNQYDLYRVISIKESDINKYEVVGVNYWPEKFAEIETGLYFQQNTLQTYYQAPSSPRNLQLASQKLSQSQVFIQYSFIVDNYSLISNYMVFATTGTFSGNSVPGTQYLVGVLPPTVTTAEYFVPAAATYNFRVYAINGDVYSTGYAGNGISITSNLAINNVNISALTTVIS